jgi:mutator protein MutT
MTSGKFAASAIILKGRNILLVKKSSNARVFPRTWACPGGKGDEGETPEQAVVREVKEEVDIDFKPTRLYKTGRYMDRDLHRFLGEWSGDITLDEKELIGYGWFTYEEAKRLDLAFDYKEVLEMLHDEGLI